MEENRKVLTRIGISLLTIIIIPLTANALSGSKDISIADSIKAASGIDSESDFDKSDFVVDSENPNEDSETISIEPEKKEIEVVENDDTTDTEEVSINTEETPTDTEETPTDTEEIPTDTEETPTYSTEMQESYERAYENGIITESSIDEANLHDALTNLELADIMNKYVENVLGRTPDLDKCKTIDDSEKEENQIILKSCQLGLAYGFAYDANNVTSLRKNETNRAIFGTTLSIALWGDKYEGGDPYYANHLKALKDAGILNKIDNPENIKELKGYVLITLKRSINNDIDDVDCDDPLIELSCNTNPANCPIQCVDKINCEGMKDANISHTINGDIITLKWDEIEGDDVEISIYNPETEMYESLGTAKISDKKFTYKFKRQGEQSFILDDGCDYYYKVNVSGVNNTEIKSDSKIISTGNKMGNRIESKITKKNSLLRSAISKNSDYSGGSENSYTAEIIEAYEFAYENGITSANTIEEANINSTLTRGSMAKMLVNYAMNVLRIEPDISKGSPKFKDVTKELDDQYDNSITLAYQLGILGQNVESGKFRPYDLVTRAEFVSALSRMLYGTEDGNPYYETHFDKLKEEGIINNTGNPSASLLRGYAMLMLMRAEGTQNND